MVSFPRLAALAIFPMAVATAALANDHGQAPAPPAGLSGTPESAPGSSGGDTYLLDADNEDNAGSGVADGDMGVAGAGNCLYNTDSLHPIEFNIFMTGPLPATSATLLLETWDVDFAAGELDQVYFNNTLVGVSTGANQEWSNSTFTIPLGLVQSGKNTVRIQVDVLNVGDWCTWIRRAQLVIDGGSAATASCRSITTSAQSYAPGATVGVTVEADTTLATQSLRFEVNLKNQSSQIINGTSRVATVIGTLDDPQVFALGLGAAPNGTYSAEALLFDASTGLLQATCATTFSVNAVPPTNTPTNTPTSVPTITPTPTPAVPLLQVDPAGGQAFPNTRVGSSETVTYTVRNVGGGMLAASASAACAGFSVAPTTLPPLGASQQAAVIVTFAPSGPGLSSCLLVVESNGGIEERQLTARGVEPPPIPVVPSPVSPAGLLMILGLTGSLFYLLPRRSIAGPAGRR